MQFLLRFFFLRYFDWFEVIQANNLPNETWNNCFWWSENGLIHFNVDKIVEKFIGNSLELWFSAPFLKYEICDGIIRAENLTFTSYSVKVQPHDGAAYKIYLIEWVSYF